MRTTLSMVAKKAGLSPTSVSQILNNRDTRRYPLKTRERVYRTAEELNYKGINSRRRNRRLGSLTQTVCFVICHSITWDGETRTPFYTRMLDGIQGESHRQGLQLNLASGLEGAAP